MTIVIGKCVILPSKDIEKYLQEGLFIIIQI